MWQAPTGSPLMHQRRPSGKDDSPSARREGSSKGDLPRDEAVPVDYSSSLLLLSSSLLLSPPPPPPSPPLPTLFCSSGYWGARAAATPEGRRRCSCADSPKTDSEGRRMPLPAPIIIRILNSLTLPPRMGGEMEIGPKKRHKRIISGIALHIPFFGNNTTSFVQPYWAPSCRRPHSPPICDAVAALRRRRVCGDSPLELP